MHNDMAAITEKSKINFLLRLSSMYWQQKTVANLIDDNVQLHVLSEIPDNFQGVPEIVSDRLP